MKTQIQITLHRDVPTTYGTVNSVEFGTIGRDYSAQVGAKEMKSRFIQALDEVKLEAMEHFNREIALEQEKADKAKLESTKA